MNLTVNGMPITAKDYINRILASAIRAQAGGFELMQHMKCRLAEKSDGPSNLLVIEIDCTFPDSPEDDWFCAFTHLHNMSSGALISAILTGYELDIDLKYRQENSDDLFVRTVSEAPVVFH